MGLSARRLGEMVDVSSQVMNGILKERGYLSGEMGNYNVTEKGRKIVIEKGWDNGYGGYARRGYNYLEWPDNILEELNITPELVEKVKNDLSEQRRQKRMEAELSAEENFRKFMEQKNKSSMNRASIPKTDTSDNKLGYLAVAGVIGASVYGLVKLVKYMIDE
ncbi:hypothetical protein [Porcincola intestinalis]|uniref:Uncharacterized protein n=1 Tax=Porcincola intestinalis TaxID=2606632 RepID=A0A6L5X6N3_9FIRM|nr:hypothetical protein [Porcincola intestinalis]MSS14544.1 hypothetical protein [Porcincola intestinalis]